MMKIEKINDYKLKITLTITDLKERNIDFNNLSYNSPQTQELFWDMMHQAEIEYGFSASDSQLFIEAAPGSGDCLVITVTKVSEDTDFESIHKYIKNKFKKSELKSKRKNKKVSSELLIYSFKEFDDLCSATKIIYDLYSGNSTLYKCKDLYYLALSNTGIANTNPAYFDSIMTEYGERISNINFIDGYLNEYGTKLIDSDAMMILMNYFDK